MTDVIQDEDRLLWIDRDPEEGFMTLGLYAAEGDGFITMDKEEALRLHQLLTVDLQIKGAIPWEEEDASNT